MPRDLPPKFHKGSFLSPVPGGLHIADSQLPGIAACPPPGRSAAIEIVRLFNTLALTHKIKSGEYASLADLRRSETMRSFRAWLARNQGSMGLFYRALYRSLDYESEHIVPGWTLSIHVSEARDGYLLILASHVDSRDGELAVFASDDGWVIYEGPLKALALPTKYTRLREALPNLAPLTRPAVDLLFARAKGFIQKVAYSGMQEEVVPVQNSSCARAGCCRTGSCSTPPVLLF